MSLSYVRQVDRCRACGSVEIQPFLDLGSMPPANALIPPGQEGAAETRFPLALCSCRTCELVQLTHVVSATTLFRQYVYFSSQSGAMARHFATLANDVADRFVPAGGLVVEMGSNDGILLRSLVDRPIRILGVDPAENVAEQARSRGVPTIADFFSEDLARRIRVEHGGASAIFANNVFAHIDNLDDVLRGVDELLTPGGVLVIEVPYIVDFLEHLEFDTVYHEHLSYFGVRPLARLFGRFGFEIFDVSHWPVHGGTIRVFVRRARDARSDASPVVAEYDARERAAGTAESARLARFARDIAGLRDTLVQLVDEIRRGGKRVVGYTAPAKGIVLLNYCSLDVARIPYLADSTPAKQGCLAPGVRIPIVSPEHFRSDGPDYAILLAWNHASEILAKEAAWQSGGGRFIVPVPSVQVV